MLSRQRVDPPCWVYRDAVLDFDFANNRYFGGTVSRKSMPEYGATLGIQGLGDAWTWAPDNNGKLYGPFPAYSLRIVPGTGLWVEKNTKTASLHNRDLTESVWVKSNCAVTRNQPGNDVYDTPNAACLLTATSNNATCLQQITRSVRDYRVSAYVKRSNGSGAVEMTVDGGASWTDVSANITSDVYTLVSIPYQNLADPEVGFRLAVSGDAIVVDFFQCQDGRTVDTPMTRDTTAAYRNNEMPSLNTTGNSYNDGQRIIRNIMMDTTSSYLFDFCSQEVDLTRRVYGSASLGEMFVYSQSNDSNALFGNSNTGSRARTSDSANIGLENNNKIAGVLQGGSCKVCQNGGAIATGTGGARWGTYYDHIGIGNNGGSSQSLGGFIKRMTFWRRELDDGEMTQLSML